MIKEFFYSDWASLKHIAICGFIAFFTLLIFIRITGKRTLAKLNAFDFIVTITLGSTLSSMMLAEVPLLDGIVALIITIALQYLLALLSRASDKVDKIINAQPALLYYDGMYMEEMMKREGITKRELFAEVRRAGHENLDHIRAIILELNGSFSVVLEKEAKTLGISTIEDVIGN